MGGRESSGDWKECGSFEGSEGELFARSFARVLKL